MVRNAMFSRHNKKLQKQLGSEPLEGDATHIDSAGTWNPLFVPEQAPKDARPFVVGICADCGKPVIGDCDETYFMCDECNAQYDKEYEEAATFQEWLDEQDA